MNASQKSKMRKILILIFCALIVIFGLINVTWYFGYMRYYDQIAENMEQTSIDGTGGSESLRYKKEVDGYLVTLKKPAYLGRGGFVSVSTAEEYTVEVDEEGNVISDSGMEITLFIWPQFGGDFLYGLDFYEASDEFWEQVYINRDLTLVDSSEDTKINELIQSNEQQIGQMFDVADEICG